ncbi:hypothetical protein V3O24_09745 [Methylobacter sp. Wu8]|uniref:Uncharacterized protein n=1 Tax=Methylobacter tundripaludum TaxID=173365 RepID=A0A2S6H4L9_9GAMM|nr:hypothetical protein [Methylobacter tundripaludum]PPK72404.1 hypothetical protein B0F88_104198 [Methylobacter tundripaludum]
MLTPRYIQIVERGIGLPLYSLVSNHATTDYWAGYLPSVAAGFGSDIDPSITWQDKGGVYLFAKECPDDFSTFLDELNLLLPKLSPAGDVRILWVYNPNQASACWQWNILKASAVSGARGLNWVVMRQALFSIGSYTLAIDAQATMDLDETDNCSITFSVDQVKFFGPNGRYPAQHLPVSIPLWGAQQGAFNAYLTLAEGDLSKLAVKLQYATTTATSNFNVFDEVETLDMPILSLPTGSTMQMKLSFDPLNPLDPERSHLSFFPYDNTTPSALDSTFITPLGMGTTLTPAYLASPLWPARLVFNRTPTTYASGGEASNFAYHLTPDGAFSLNVVNPPTGQSINLLCGLSGVESIQFAQDDIMMFYSGQPAGVDVTMIPGSEEITLKLSPTSPFTTSWAMILPGNAAAPSVRTYYSEPDRSSFYANTDSTYPSQLAYYPTSRITLPDTPNPSSATCCFPIASYQGMVQAALGFGSKPKNVEAFEFQLLNPERQKLIEQMAQPSTPATGSTTVYALTPQGYQATFVNGVWTGISIAKATVTGEVGGSPVTVSNVDIEFSSANETTPLPDALQKAFLTNQQFLVITADITGNDGSNLATFAPQVMMSDWSFILNMPKTTTPGNYTNVLIFKSGNTSINQMARNPHLWTQYADFNDTSSDAEGNFLSNWLVEYLENAEALYDNGNGVASLENFCTLINDENWNGFLALKVKVGDIATLPVDVQALVADISGNLYAHHLGNEINHVGPSKFASIKKGDFVKAVVSAFPDNTQVAAKTDTAITLSSASTSEIPEGTYMEFVELKQEISLKLSATLPTSTNILQKSDFSPVEPGAFNSIKKGYFVKAMLSGGDNAFPDKTQVTAKTDTTITLSSASTSEIPEGTYMELVELKQEISLKLSATLPTSTKTLQKSDFSPGADSYDLNSPFFGLIHYVNPQFAGEAKNPPAYVQIASDYDFTVLTLEVVFEKALETRFSNKSMLMMNTFFGDKVVQTGPNGEQGANNLILIGTYHDVDNVPSYSFSTAKGVTTDFYLASNAFNCNRIANVTMNVVKLSGSSEATDIYKASFAIRGSFDFLNDSSFDLLSYEYLPYYGLTLDVTIQHSQSNIYEMVASKLRFEKNQTEALAAGSGKQAGQALNIVRTGSLVAQFPMKLKGLVQYVGVTTTNSAGNEVPDNVSPGDMGYRLLETATPKGISFTSPSDGVAWYGLEFDLILGGKGSLAASGAISASMLLAWMPGGSGYYANASPQFKLSGPDGVSLSFDFEGVLKFGAKDIVLNRHVDASDPTKDYFYMEFQSIALTLLSISFPPGGTTNLALMGDTSAADGSIVNPTLSWLGGYAEKTN